jgi:phage host-nuclease inhibitor protein Gam
MKYERMQTALERATAAIKKSHRTIHSEIHALAKDISEYCAEPRGFALYLGRIKTVGLPVAYQAFSELRERVRQRAIKYPSRWWMWRTKHLTKKASFDKSGPRGS